MNENLESENQVRRYGPSLVLLATIGLVVLVGPHVMRQLARADQLARLAAVDEALGNSQLAEMSKTFRWVSTRIEPSVVHISTKRRLNVAQGEGDWSPNDIDDLFRRYEDRDSGEWDQYNEPRDFGTGSGWVYDEQGHIITNAHVVEGADIIEVKFFDRTPRRAILVGADPQTDIAVLRVEGVNLYPAKRAMSPSEQGDIVFAFGSPFMFEFSMSQGIVSGSGRRLGILGRQGYEDFIQTDAAINPGNSGGPLSNIYGEVIGMNTAIATRTGAFSGIGFAIPIDLVVEIADKLIASGTVTRGYLGVWINDDRRILESFGHTRGVIVDDVIPGGPAERAGLQEGDVIVAINDQSTDSASELRRRVAAINPGEEVRITFYRDGEEQVVKTTLDVQPGTTARRPTPTSPTDPENAVPDQVDPAEGQIILAKLGIEDAIAMTPELAAQRRMTYRPGILVTAVRPGSVASANLISPGVIITHVQGSAVASLPELTAALSEADLAAGVRLRLRVGQQSHYVLLQIQG